MSTASSQCMQKADSLQLGNIRAVSVERDAYGNLYALGTFVGTIEVNGNSITSQFRGTPELIVIKYDKNNNYQWHVNSEASNPGLGLAPAELKITNEKDIIIHGFSTTNAIIQCFQLKLDSPWSDSGSAFIIKIDSEGNTLWTRRSNEESFARLETIDISSNGCIVGAGFIPNNSEVNFNDVSMTNDSDKLLPFIIKFDSLGSALWIKSFDLNIEIGTVPYPEFNIKYDSKGNIIFMAGYYGSNVKLDDIELTPKSEVHNYLLAKLDSDGNALWAKSSDNDVRVKGVSLTIDTQDNIYSSGEFYNSSLRLDSTELVHEGNSDIFVAKYSSEGTLEWAKAFTGEENEFQLSLTVHPDNRLAILSTSNSSLFTVGNDEFISVFGETNSLITEMDLNGTILCNYDFSEEFYDIDSAPIAYDSLGNIIVVREFFPGNDVPAVRTIIFLGNEDNWLTAPDPSPNSISLNLGENRSLCFDETLTLDLNLPCNARGNILWSDGSTENTITIDSQKQGEIWVRVSFDGVLYSDTVSVEFESDLSTLNISDAFVCDETYRVDLSELKASEYLWNDSATSSSKSFIEEGTYFVTASNRCQVVSDTFNISFHKPFIFSLGADTTVCENFEILLDVTQTKADYKWSNDEKNSFLLIQEPGTYWVEVSNQCETKIDSLTITYLDLERIFIPNVITPNGDNDNEFFVVQESLLPATLRVFNRWGQEIYFNANYQNQWNASGVSSGVYYYEIQSKSCFQETMKGSLSILR